MTLNWPEVAAATVVSFALGYVCKSRNFRFIPKIPTKNINKTKLVLIVRTDLGMTKGKVASQCSHATLTCYKQAIKEYPDVVKLWEGQGQPKICLRADGEEELKKLAKTAASNGIVTTLVRDRGSTQVQPGTITACGMGPFCENKINEVTGSLKLF